MNDPQPVQAGAELAPCPFCGIVPDLWQLEDGPTLRHEKDGCALSGLWFTAGHWNTRITHAGGSSELVERLRNNGWTASSTGEPDNTPYEAADQIATLTDELTRLREKVGRLEAAFPADFMEVMRAMDFGYSHPSERIAESILEDTGLVVTTDRIRQVQRALRTLGLAGFGVLYDEDEPKMKGRGYWLEHSARPFLKALADQPK